MFMFRTEESDTFTNRLIAKVVANLQLFVDKIHIRYEDGGADPTVMKKDLHFLNSLHPHFFC